MDAVRGIGLALLLVLVIVEIGREWRLEELAPGMIALDGAVTGPLIDPDLRRYSFDHHSGCCRLITTSTCQQVLDALCLGLDPSGMTVLVNDLDADTILSVWLLKNALRWRSADELARVRPLVYSVGARDCHGPAFPAPWPELARHLHETVFDPVTVAKRGGFPVGAVPVLKQALASLDLWWEAGLPCAPARTEPLEYPTIDRRRGWVLVDSGKLRPGSKVAGADWVYAQGHDRMVLTLELPGGRRQYTLAKRSDLVADFPLSELYRALNEVEARQRGRDLAPGQTWGGGSSIGGGPRDGSVLSVGQVAEVIDTVTRNHRAPP